MTFILQKPHTSEYPRSVIILSKPSVRLLEELGLITSSLITLSCPFCVTMMGVVALQLFKMRIACAGLARYFF